MLLTPEILVPSCKLLLKYDVYIDVIKCIVKMYIVKYIFYLATILFNFGPQAFPKFSAVRNDQNSIYCSIVSETI